MTGAVDVRRMRPGEECEVCGLVGRVFRPFVAAEFPREGIQELLGCAHPAAMVRRCAAGQVVLVAERDGRIVGMLKPRGFARIAVPFPETPGQGIGRERFEEALAICRCRLEAAGRVRAHASRYAVPIYRKLGFKAEGPQRTENGITCIPMAASHQRSG